MRYGVQGDEAARFGLPCGGTLELVLDLGEPLESVPRSAREEGHAVTVDGRRVTIEKA